MSKYSCWTPKQKRCFSRLRLVFLHNFFYKKQRVRFLTLTSASDSPDIHRSYRALIMRLRRKYGSFEYFAVRTNEGYGVYHIVFTGCYVPKQVLRGMWYDIHGAYMVNVQWVRGTPMNVSRYLVNQYISGQYGFERYSWSWRLVFPGFVSVWKRMLFLTGFDFRLVDYFFMFGRVYLRKHEVVFVVVKGRWKMKKTEQMFFEWECQKKKRYREVYGRSPDVWGQDLVQCSVCGMYTTIGEYRDGRWVCGKCLTKKHI